MANTIKWKQIFLTFCGTILVVLLVGYYTDVINIDRDVEGTVMTPGSHSKHEWKRRFPQAIIIGVQKCGTGNVW